MEHTFTICSKHHNASNVLALSFERTDAFLCLS